MRHCGRKGQQHPRLFPVLLLLLFAAGCARPSLKKPSPTPDIAIPEKWTADGFSAEAVLEEWWTRFGDEQLTALVEEAVRENFDLQVAAARVKVAQAQAEMAGGGDLPAVAASVDGSRRRQNFIGFPIPGAEQEVPSRTFTSYGVSLDISWEADIWGRLADAEAAAVAELLASHANLRGLKLSLASQVAKAWFSLLEARAQLRLAEQTLESFEKTTEIVRVRYEAGLRPAADVRQARTNLEVAAASIRQRQAQVDAALRQVEVLVARYPAAGMPVSSRLPALPDVPPTGLPSQLLERRPDVVSAQWRLAAADSRIKQSEKQLYPSFSLTTAAGTATRQLKDVINGDFFVWTILGNLVQPIFEGGRLRAQVRSHEALFQELASSYASTVLQAFLEVENSLAAEEFLKQQKERLIAAQEQAEAAASLLDTRYREGIGEILSLLEARRGVYELRSRILALQQQLLRNRVDLHLALGGGFSNPQPQATDNSHSTSGDSDGSR